MSLDGAISSSLKLPLQLIHGLAQKASHSYYSYTIPKKSGGVRTIHHPSRELKALQRWLARHVIASWRVHDAAYAYRKNLSVHDHAIVHEKSAFLLRIDLQKFFPSITSSDVRLYLGRRPAGTSGWNRADEDLFTSLVSKEGRLTIGAPTSPGLSNALCWDLDVELAALAERVGANYTRYADDIFFSTSERDILSSVPAEVDKTLAALPFPRGLQRSVKKTLHSSKRGRRRVTGIVLSSDGRAVVGRARKREIRALIHRFNAISPDEQKRVRGLVAYVRGIEPDFVNALMLKYGPGRLQGIV